MAIGLHTAGTWAFDSTGSITVTLPTHSAGDMLIVRVAIKSGAVATCTASTATSGWAKVGQFANGTTNSGNGTGSVLVAAFWKIAASGAETNPTIDFTQTNTQGGVCAQAYNKAAAENWETPVGDGGGDTSAGTDHSATIQSHIAVRAGDLVDFFTGICDDTTMTLPTITQTGVTYAAVVESPAAAGSDTGGADGAYDGGYRIANSGTSSAAAVVTGTLSTSETGSSWMTRLRVNNNITVTPTTLAHTLATFAPTVTKTLNQRVTPTTLALTTATFAPTVTASDRKVATPTTLALTLATFAPTIRLNKIATPSTLALSLSAFAPTVSATQNVSVTPTTLALTLAAFSPTVTTPRAVTPNTISLSLATFAPTVSTPRLMTPDVASLSVQTFAPTVFAPRLLTPPAVPLTLSSFAPTVQLPRTVTPGSLSLIITTYAPSLTDSIEIVPETAALSITAFAPTVSTPQTITPQTISLALSTFAPSSLSPRLITPTTLTLTLSTFSPTVSVGSASVTVTPGTLALTLTGYAPSAQLSVIPDEIVSIVISPQNFRAETVLQTHRVVVEAPRRIRRIEL